MLIDGIHIPLTTPFNRDGASFLRKLEYNVARYSLTPAAGLVALTGEGAALSDEETDEVLRVIGETAAAEKVLVAAVRKATVRAALAVADRAADAKFDAVLLSAPPDWAEFTARSEGERWSKQSAELRLFFLAVADGSSLPVVLHSDSSAFGFTLPVDVIGELAQHPNILGIFDAQMTSERYRRIAEATATVRYELTVTHVFSPVTRRMRMRASSASLVTAGALASGAAFAVPPAGELKTRVKMTGFQMMGAGSIFGLAEMLGTGLAGSMPILAACVPQACYEVYAAFKDGDPALAAEKQQRLIEADQLIRQLGIAGVKHACDLNGYYGGSVRLPRVSLSALQAGSVNQVFGGLRN